MADSFRPREVVTYPISIKRKRDQSDYTKDLVHQRPNSTQNRRVDPHAGKVLGIDRYVPDHSNYVPSRNAMHIQGGRHPKGGRWDASERDPGSVRPLGNANGYPTTSSDKHNGKRLNQTQSAQRVSGREQSVRRFSEISRLEESHNSGQQQVSSRPDKVNTVPVYTANAVPQCTNNEESAYRTSQTMPNAVELIKACVPTTSEQLLKSSTPDICNDASVDIAQREYSRRELQSPVESVSTSDVDRDKPDCVNSISNYSYRGVMRDTSSHKRYILHKQPVQTIRLTIIRLGSLSKMAQHIIYTESRLHVPLLQPVEPRWG